MAFKPFARLSVVFGVALSMLLVLALPASANSTTNNVKIGSFTRTTISSDLYYFNDPLQSCQNSKYISVRAEWTVSGVTANSVYIQTVLLRYYATRPVTLEARYVVNGNGTNVWQQNYWDGTDVTGSFTRTYTINKSVAFSGTRPLYFGINQRGSSFPNEADWCYGSFTSRFYLKPVA